MNLKLRKNIPYALFITLFTIDVASMLLQKIAASHGSGHGFSFYLSLASQPWAWISLVLAPFQLWVWTKILARTELSLAYPMSSLAYPLTMFAAQIALREHISLKVWLGAMLITFGVALLGSKMEKKGKELLVEPKKYTPDNL